MSASPRQPGSGDPAGPARSCLLVMPRSFYSYADLIREQLIARGYAVTVANDEYPEGLGGKLLGQFLLPLARRITRRTFASRFLGEGVHYDLVLIIKGRGMSRALIEDLRARADRVVAYHYDSFAYNRSPLEWFPALDACLTFDHEDAARHGFPVVELFASLPADPADAAVDGPAAGRRDQVLSVVMRNYASRLRHLDRILSALPWASRQVYIFESNPVSLAINVIRHPVLFWKYRRHIHRVPMAYPDFVALLARSEFVVDYSHRRQHGITMRCFEALAAGARIISNNPRLHASAYFDAGNSLIVAETDEVDSWLLRFKTLRESGPISRRAGRSISQFVDEVLAHVAAAPAREVDRPPG